MVVNVKIPTELFMYADYVLTIDGMEAEGYGKVE